MPGGTNLATKYAKEIDERWSVSSRISLVTGNNRYNFKGDKTVVIYSIPTAPLNNYTRSGTSRYGTLDDLGRNIQTCVVSQDKAFTFAIDKGDQIQSEYVSDPGTALAAMIKNKVVPAYDRYCFSKIAQAAKDNGAYDSTAITASNAYEMVLKGTEYMGDRGVPIDECVCFVSCKVSGFLLRDPAFIKYGNASQEMVKRRQLGICAGMEICEVPNDRFPTGTSFLIVNKEAIVAPKQMEEYNVHENPLGISGTVCEGRAIYDCFVLNEKIDGVYYHGGQQILGLFPAQSNAGAAGKSLIVMDKEKDVASGYIYVITGQAKASLPTATYGTAIDTSAAGSWYGATSCTSNPQEITPTSTHKYFAIVETDASKYPLYYNTGKLNVG
ncbi:MAG: N4-gp56 family major capsid protein [Eubacteriales bacterium]|nr:N4-gp56 family major capsid protein [Eubacteriales bacterium]